jgi:hypothetical protein
MSKSFIFIAMNLAILNSVGCFAQNRAADNPAEMSREDWQAQITASRARAEAMRREHRRFVVRQPTKEEIAERNSKRVLEDDSLLPGDIISTNQGLYQFQGSPEGDRKPGDFVRIR